MLLVLSINSSVGTAGPGSSAWLRERAGHDHHQDDKWQHRFAFDELVTLAKFAQSAS